MEKNIENLKRSDFITIPIKEEVKLIPIPELLIDALKPLEHAVIQSVNKHGAYDMIETGIIKLDQISNETKVARIFFAWISESGAWSCFADFNGGHFQRAVPGLASRILMDGTSIYDSRLSEFSAFWLQIFPGMNQLSAVAH